MRNAFSFLSEFLLLMFLSLSCAKETQEFYPVDYNVINHTDSGIKVVFNGVIATYGSYRIINDSIVHINPSDEFKLIVLCELSETGVNNPEENYDSIHAINTLRIYMSDSIASTTNFKLTNNWNYHKISNQHAELNLEVTNDDFK